MHLAKVGKQDEAWISNLLVRALTSNGRDLGSILLFQWVFMWFILSSHWIKYLNSHYSSHSSLDLAPPLPGEGPIPPLSHAQSCCLPIISRSLSNVSVIIWCKVEQLPQQRLWGHPSLTAFPLFVDGWVQRLLGRAGNAAELWFRAVGWQQEQWHCSSSGCACSKITPDLHRAPEGTTHKIILHL